MVNVCADASFVCDNSQLCSEGELYRSRSGLNKHTTKVHGRQYWPHGNLYVPIPPEELAAARAKIKARQFITLLPACVSV